MKVVCYYYVLNKIEDDSFVVSLVFGPNKIAEFFVSRFTILLLLFLFLLLYGGGWLVDNNYYGYCCCLWRWTINTMVTIVGVLACQRNVVMMSDGCQLNLSGAELKLKQTQEIQTAVS
jgi:hypothetical protein